MILGFTHQFEESVPAQQIFHCAGNGKEFHRAFLQHCSSLDEYFSNEFLRSIDQEEFSHRFDAPEGSNILRWFIEAKLISEVSE